MHLKPVLGQILRNHREYLGHDEVKNFLILYGETDIDATFEYDGVHFSDISIHVLHQVLKELLLVLSFLSLAHNFAFNEFQGIAMIVFQHLSELLCDI